MMESLGVDGNWLPVRDADLRVVALYRRHYSAKRGSDNSHGIVGPGEKMILLTVSCDALFVWHLVQHPDKRNADKRRAQNVNGFGKYFGGQEGVMCSIFRNEGPTLSSTLILEAEELAWTRWPGRRLFTYVWDAKVQSVNPGYCFKVAGWQVCGRNKDGRLTILEKWPTEILREV